MSVGVKDAKVKSGSAMWKYEKQKSSIWTVLKCITSKGRVVRQCIMVRCVNHNGWFTRYMITKGANRKSASLRT